MTDYAGTEPTSRDAITERKLILRTEFRHVDTLYVRQHHPDAIDLANRYNMARSAIDPNRAETITEARKALTRLMRAIQS